MNRVIEIAPSKEKELLFDAYMLRASLHDSRKDFKAAADDLEKAAKIEPDNMALTDMKGKLAFHNEEYDVAKKQLYIDVEEKSFACLRDSLQNNKILLK